MLSRSGLFTALSPAAHSCHLPNNHNVAVASAINFVRGLPRNLISTFGSALSRILNTSLVLGIISTSSRSCRQRLRTISHILSRVNTKRHLALAMFGGVSLLSDISQLDFHHHCPRTILFSTRANRKLSSLISHVTHRTTTASILLSTSVPCHRNTLVALIRRRKALLRRRCLRSNIHVITGLPTHVTPQLRHCHAR